MNTVFEVILYKMQRSHFAVKAPKASYKNTKKEYHGASG